MKEHPTTCPGCGKTQTHRGRRDLLELVRATHDRLAKAIVDADHRRNTREPPELTVNAVLYESETCIQLMEAVQAAGSVLRRELYVADGGCLHCLDLMGVVARPRCTVCGASGPGCGPDGTRCRVLGCPGSLA